LKNKIIKKILIGSSIFSSLLLNASEYVKVKENQNSYIQKIIKENGTIRKINISKIKYRTFDKKEGLILSFKAQNSSSIENLENRYSIKLKHKLSVGYYIFDNNSDLNDIELVENIIENEDNIRSIKPNWKLNVQAK